LGDYLFWRGIIRKNEPKMKERRKEGIGYCPSPIAKWAISPEGGGDKWAEEWKMGMEGGNGGGTKIGDKWNGWMGKWAGHLGGGMGLNWSLKGEGEGEESRGNRE
jgi:hypothetical protein